MNKYTVKLYISIYLRNEIILLIYIIYLRLYSVYNLLKIKGFIKTLINIYMYLCILIIDIHSSQVIAIILLECKNK